MGCTDSKSAKTAGANDGGKAKNKSDTNRDKKKAAAAAAAAPAGGGIECYIPDDETLANYLRYLDAVRQDAASKGIMAPTAPTMGFPPTPASAATPRNKRRDKTGAGSPTDGVSPGATPAATPTTTLPAGVPPAPDRAVSAFCCRPLLSASNNSPMVIGKGLYSAVYLADLTVLAGPPEKVAARLAALSQPEAATENDGVFQKRYLIALKEIRLFARQRSLTTLQKLEDHIRHWARVSAYCPGLVQCISMEQVFDETDGSGKLSTSLSVAAPHASPHYVESVSVVRSYGVITPESAGGDAHEPAADGKGGVGKGKLFGRAGGKKSGTAGSGTASGGAGTSASAAAAKGKSAASLVSIAEPTVSTSTAAAGSGPRAQIPNRIRIYTDFQRYGTLRSVQARQMQRFQTKYMHELTARALMHDLLITLAQLHAEDTLQYDVNANAIFIHRPMRAVYHTYFPAYISDLAAGDWHALPTKQLMHACVLGDPATNAEGEYDGGNGDAANNNNNNNTSATAQACSPNMRATGTGGAAAGQRPLDLSPGRLAVHAPSSAEHADPLSPLLLAQQHQNMSMAVNLHDLQLDVTMVHGPVSPNALSPSSPGVGSPSRTDGFGSGTLANNVSFIAAGREAFAGTDGTGGKPALLEWNNEKLKQCMAVNGYEDCEGPPLPSPHDGAECQDDANMFMTASVHEGGSKSLLESQCVAAINFPSQPVTNDVSAPGSPMKTGGAETKTTTTTKTAAAAPGEAIYGNGGVVLWSPDRFPPASVASATVPETRHVAPPQTLTATTDASAFADLSEPLDLEGSMSVGNESFFVSESLKKLSQHLSDDLQRRRLRPPITKLNHVAMLRRVLAAPMVTGSTADVPAYQYVSVAHAAPEALLRRQFTKASDIYAFAMTFIELVTPDDAFMSDCTPATKPKTRAEKTEYDETFYNNMCKWYNLRLSLVAKHKEALEEEQRLPPCVEQPAPPPVVMPVPEHLSDECKRMLRWCLQTNPEKRPTAAQLLSSKYFLFGDWISRGEPSCPEARLPEKPWEPLPASYEELAQSAGLPLLSSIAPLKSKQTASLPLKKS